MIKSKEDLAYAAKEMAEFIESQMGAKEGLALATTVTAIGNAVCGAGQTKDEEKVIEAVIGIFSDEPLHQPASDQSAPQTTAMWKGQNEAPDIDA